MTYHTSYLEDAVRTTRKELLTLLETAYGSTQQFGIIRSRILYLFGRDGLEGLVRRLDEKRSGSEENELTSYQK